MSIGRFLTVAVFCVLTLPATAALAAHVPQIVAFGDSITAGFGLPPEQAFPVRLEARLHDEGIAARVLNRGNSGDTTADGVSRLNWALGDDRPDIVILELGANDALRGIDPKTVRANLETLIDKIQASGAKLLLLGMQAPPNWGEDYRRAFDAIYPDLAKAHNVPLVPFFLEGVAMNPQLNQPDGLHPNEKGVAIIVGHIAPEVAKLLRSTDKGGRS